MTYKNILFLLIILLVAVFVVAENTNTSSLEHCSDGLDNDGNGLIDSEDPYCSFEVSGKVLDNNNTPVNGLVVDIFSLENDSETFKTYSVGSEGLFRYRHLSPGNYSLNITENDYYLSEPVTFFVDENNSAVNDIILNVSVENSTLSSELDTKNSLTVQVTCSNYSTKDSCESKSSCSYEREGPGKRASFACVEKE